jgi:hypothetical protein
MTQGESSLFRVRSARLPDFSWYNIPKLEEYTKKDHKMYQMAIK